MPRNTSYSVFIGFLFIPLIASVIWALNYGIDNVITYRFFLVLLIPSVVVFVIGELLFSAIFQRVRSCFRFGFWCGFFAIAPYYAYKIWFQFKSQLEPLPIPVVYAVYILSALVASVAVGLITWCIFDLLHKIKTRDMPRRFILKRILIVVLSLIVLLIVILERQLTDRQIIQQKTSYRGVVERELQHEPLNNVIVLGIDGADWQVIDPLIEKGKLPNLKKTMTEGRWGILESIEPSRSPLIWSTIFTGRSPENHGIIEWDFSQSSNRLVKAVWNILSEFNLRTTMINVPGTYPPEEILGKEISGFPMPNPMMNNIGWISSTEKQNTIISSYSPLKLKLDEDGNYSGKIIVTDIQASKFKRALINRKLKHLPLEMFLYYSNDDIFNGEIPIAQFKYLTGEKRIDIYPLADTDKPLASLKEGDWTDYIKVQLAPGLVGVVKLKIIQLDGEKIVLFITPFFSDSGNPINEYTFPNALAKDISKMFGQYNVEMTFLAARDLITIPAIKEIVFETEAQKSEVGKVLFDEREWDLFIQVFVLTDRVQHPAWGFKYGTFPKDLLKGLYKSDLIERTAVTAIDEAYEKADEWLGDMLKNFNPKEDVVIILSDHGFTAGEDDFALGGGHRLEGMYVILGGPVKSSSLSDYKKNESQSKSVNDVTKNILYLMGLPIGNDMVGELWYDLYDESWVELNQPSIIPTYDKEIENGGIMQTIDPSALEQLKGLGYLE